MKYYMCIGIYRKSLAKYKEVEAMRKIIIAGHGNFAEGIQSSLELIMGMQDCITTLCTYLDFENVEEKVDNMMKEIHESDEIVILTDLFGGSVNNFFLRYLEKGNVHLIAGTNLLLLIEIVCHINDADLNKVIEDALYNVRSSIVYCNKCREEDVLSEF